ncbi:MAG: TonB-dependent receptor [Novosphingobium sp.]
MKVKTLYARLLLGSMLGSCLVAPAWAQDSGEAGYAAADIIVTARRVEERLQDVPISITVFSQEQLAQQNVFAARDLAIYTPSLATQSRYGADFASFSIRGFTQEARTTASVGVYFADVVVPRSSQMSAAGDGAGPGALFDLQNVQVLKGPQGTLFGRNTTGGAVVLVPNRPSDRFEGYVEGSIGNYDMRRVQAVVNLPASETLRFRAGVDWQKRDGYLKNISGVGPKDFADIDYFAGRLSMLWDVTESIENYTIGSYSKSTPNGAMPKVTDCNYPTNAARQPVPEAGPYQLNCQQIARERGQGTYTVTNWVPWAYQSVEVWQIINSTKWQVGDNLTIKNIVSYGKSRQDQAMDLFGVWNPLGATVTVPTTTAPYFRTINVPAQYQGMGFGADTSISANGLHAGYQSTFTEELQLQGTTNDGSLTWQAGAYYERSRPLGYSGTQSMAGVLCDNEQQWANFTCTDIRAVDPALGTGARNYQVGRINYRNLGLYAQATYKLTEQFSIDAGIRYTWDKTWGSGQMMTVAYSAATGWNTPTFSCTMPGVTYVNSPEDCTEDYRQVSKAPTWMLGLNFKPIDDILLYAKYSRGYRQGAISPIAAYGFKTYKPERVDVYEGGIKASFDGAVRGTFNVSGFYNKFKNMQLQVAFLDLAPNTTLATLSPGPAIVNAGASRIYGFEAEATLQPIEGLSLSAAYSYIDSKLTDFIQPDLSAQITNGYDTVSGGPIKGTRLSYTPKYKLTLSANYRLPVNEEVGKVSFGAVYVRTGSVFYGVDTTMGIRADSIFPAGDPQRDYSVAPPYDLVNFSFNWENIGQGPISLGAFMTNAFGKVYYDARGPGSRGWVQRYLGEPRTYGMRVRYSW